MFPELLMEPAKLKLTANEMFRPLPVTAPLDATVMSAVPLLPVSVVYVPTQRPAKGLLVTPLPEPPHPARRIAVVDTKKEHSCAFIKYSNYKYG